MLPNTKDVCFSRIVPVCSIVHNKYHFLPSYKYIGSEKDKEICSDHAIHHFTLNFEILHHHYQASSVELTGMISFIVTLSGNALCPPAVVSF